MANKYHYWNVVWIAFALPIVFAMLDLVGASIWHTLGGWEAYAYQTVMHTYQFLIWTFADVVIVGIALTYFFATRDRSESLALFLIPVILLKFGVEDVIFYVLGNHQLFGMTMPWLTGNLWPVTLVAWALGEPVVTGATLVVSAALGVLVAMGVARYLVGVNWKK